MSAINPAASPQRSGPRGPHVTAKDLLAQFWLDLYGKEVQSAATYSYMWMADQMGHVCLGIVIQFSLTFVARYALPLIGADASWANIAGLVVGLIAVSYWEYRAYGSSVAVATGLFPLDRKLLRNNAIIAAAYMSMGLGIGFAFHQTAPWSAIGFVALALLAIVCAPPWLRQKIIWQKASLPYLFRLADAQRTIGADAAQQLQNLIDRGAPPTAQPFQVVVGGPIGSGRTAIAAGIGTEFAFRKRSVRYLSMDRLLECAARPANPHFADDPGPPNINFWRWSEAQVVIIDDIGPLIAAHEQEHKANVEQFRQLLERGLGAIAPVLAKCHTVWVIGDLRPAGETAMAGDALNGFARIVAEFCDAQQEVLVIELSAKEPILEPGKPALKAATQPAQLRRVAR